MRNIGIDAAKDYITLSLKLYSDIRPLTQDELKLESLKEEFANPTPKNITWLVSLFDEPDYLNGLSLTVNSVDTAAATAIGELSSRRNKIAHGDASEIPSSDDVWRLTKFCHLFGNRIVRDLTVLTERCYNPS